MPRAPNVQALVLGGVLVALVDRDEPAGWGAGGHRTALREEGVEEGNAGDVHVEPAEGPQPRNADSPLDVNRLGVAPPALNAEGDGRIDSERALHPGADERGWGFMGRPASAVREELGYLAAGPVEDVGVTDQ